MSTFPFDTSTTDRLLSTTRSVRKRLDLSRPVEPEIVLDCLRLALQAPTAGNRQRWRFVVVTDPAKRSALADIYRAAGADYLREQAALAGDGQDRRVYESAIYLAEHLQDVPVHVIACIEGRLDPDAGTRAAAFYGSILPAAWSLMLALRSRGLGSAWTTLHLNREGDAARLLGIPSSVTQVALLPVAYTLGTEFAPAVRPPVEEVTYWNAWDETTPPA